MSTVRKETDGAVIEDVCFDSTSSAVFAMGWIRIVKSNGNIAIKATTKEGRRGDFSFAESDLESLIELFNKGKEFYFAPRSAKGERLFFRMWRDSKDFGLFFPGGLHAAPQVADFKEFLELAKAPVNDLYRDYPEIAKAVDAHTALDKHAIWALSFNVTGTERRELLGVHGHVDDARLEALEKAAGVTSTCETVTSGQWKLFIQPASKSHSLVGHHMLSFETELSFVRTLVNGFFGATKYYVNGVLTPGYVFDSRSSNRKMHFGDVIVAIKDVPEPRRQDEGMAYFSVSKMRTYGPYHSRRFTGFTPYGLYLRRNDFNEIYIDSECEVVCPQCGNLNCNDHVILYPWDVYVFDPEDSHQFDFRIPLSSGTAYDVLDKYARGIFGTSSNYWPGQLKRVLIAGRNATYDLKRDRITKSNFVKILMK